VTGGNIKVQSIDVTSILAQAASIISTQPDNADKAETYQRIAIVLWKEGDTRQGSIFFDCAMRVAPKAGPTLRDLDIRTGPLYLADLIGQRASAGDFSGALNHLGDITDQAWKNRVLEDIVVAACEQRKFEFGEQIARSIPDTDARDAAFDDLASRSLHAGQYEFSENVAYAIQNGEDHVRALADLAMAVGLQGNQAKASALFVDAIHAAEILPSDDERDHNVGALHVGSISHNTRDTMLGIIAVRQEHSGDRTGAEDTLAKIRIPIVRYEAKQQIALDVMSDHSPQNDSDMSADESGQPDSMPEEKARKLANSGNYAAALALASTIDHPVIRRNCFGDIAQIQVQNGGATEALLWANHLETSARASTLIAIAEALEDSQDTPGN
jgi:hypothetical protein